MLQNTGTRDIVECQSHLFPSLPSLIWTRLGRHGHREIEVGTDGKEALECTFAGLAAGAGVLLLGAVTRRVVLPPARPAYALADGHGRMRAHALFMFFAAVSTFPRGPPGDLVA